MGQATIANSLGVAIASDQTVFPVTAVSSGAITNPTSTLTRPATGGSTAVTFATPTFTGATLPNGTPVVLGGVTAPTGGNFTLGNLYYVVSTSSNTFGLSLTYGGAALTGTSAGTSLTVQITYVPNTLLASNATAGSVVVPSFTIPNTAGGFLMSRIRLRTNVAGVLTTGNYANVSAWNGVQVSVDLWDTAPTFSGGDLQPYAPATGYAAWLGTYLVSMVQFGDGAAGSGGLIGASQMGEKLASGTSVFWTSQILTQAFPTSAQTLTLVAELLN